MANNKEKNISITLDVKEVAEKIGEVCLECYGVVGLSNGNIKTLKVLTKENYTQGAIWCNANNAHIEKQGGQYVIVANVPAPEQTLEEQVSSLEQTYGMTRWQREGILAEGSLYSEYTKAKAQEIEDLAKELREVSK